MDMKFNNRKILAAIARVLSLTATVLSSACVATSPDLASEHRLAANWDTDVFDISSRAEVAYRDSHWIEAARLYEQLTRRVPEDPYVWFRLGNTYARQGAHDRAIPAYEASLSRNVKQPKPWFNLGTAHMLSARDAMIRARQALRPSDPAAAMIEQRLVVLESLIHGRIEDSPSLTSSVYTR